MTTKAMKIENAEAYLQLTLRAMGNKLDAKDREFLEGAMKGYASHVLSEFLAGEKKAA